MDFRLAARCSAALLLWQSRKTSAAESQLTPDGDAEGADVAAAVEGAKRDGVLAGGERAEIDGVSLVAAVGDSVIGKDWRPGRTVDAGVAFSDLPGRYRQLKKLPARNRA